MTQQIINVGTFANDGSGDTIRVAFTKTNNNFTELYNTVAVLANTDVLDLSRTDGAFLQANMAYSKANSANLLAQAAFDFANTIISDTQIDPFARTQANAAFNVANTSNGLAQSAFSVANTANTLAQSGFDAANASSSLAQSAFSAANSSANLAQSAFNTANSSNSLAQSAFNGANSSANLAQAAFNEANSATNLAQSSFSVANTANTLAQASFNAANNAGTIIPQVLFTADATLALSDLGKHLYSTLSTANTITIPDNGTVVWPVGSAITIVNQGTANISLVQASGVSLYMAGNTTSSSRNVASYGMATLLNVSANVWFINGTGVS